MCRAELTAVVRAPVDTPVGQRARVVLIHACAHSGSAGLPPLERGDRSRDSEGMVATGAHRSQTHGGGTSFLT